MVKSHPFFSNVLKLFFGTLLLISITFRFAWDIQTQIFIHLISFGCFLLFLNYCQVKFNYKRDTLPIVFMLLILASLIGNYERFNIIFDSLIVLDALLISYLWKYVTFENKNTLLMIPQVIGAFFALIGLINAVINPHTALLSAYLPKELIINSNALAGFLFLSFSFSLINYRNNTASKLLTVLLVIGIILTRSRIAIAAAFLSFTVYYLLTSGKSKLFKYTASAAAFLLTSTTLLYISINKSHQYLNEQSMLFSNRFTWLNTAIEMFRHNILNGVGWGNYGNSFSLYKTAPVVNSLFAHNIFFQMLAEIGIFGTLVFILLVASCILRLIRLSKAGHAHNTFYLSMLFSVFGFLLINLTDFSFYIPAIMIIFFIALSSPDTKPIVSRNTPLFKSYLLLSLVTVIALVLLMPCLSLYYYDGGVAHLRKNDLALAEYALIQSCRFNPISSSPYTKLAEIQFTSYFQTKDKQQLLKAIANENEAIRLSPKNHLYWSDAAWLFWTSGDKLRAIDAIKKAITYDKFNQNHIKALSYFTLNQ